MHRFEPVTFCILIACLATALQAHSKRNVDMNHQQKFVTIQNKTRFQPNYLADRRRRSRCASATGHDVHSLDLDGYLMIAHLSIATGLGV